MYATKRLEGEKMSDNDFEVPDVETYSPSKQEEFSHSKLVMKAFNKAIENGSKEMKQGYYNVKVDNQGNVIKTYIEDTRKQFIETVKTLLMLTKRDLDKKANENIDKLLKALQEEHKRLCIEELEDWDKISLNYRRVRWFNEITYRANSLHEKLPFAQEYINFQIDTYRKILVLIDKRLGDLNDYNVEGVSG